MFLINRIIRVNIQKPLTSAFTQNIRNQLQNIGFYRPIALAVYVDSPGGSIVQAKQVAYLFREYAKHYDIPLLCFAGAKVYNSANLILTCGDKIIAAKSSEIGDLSFADNILNISELVEQQNVKVVNLSHGQYKDRLNPLQPLKETDKEWIQQIYRSKEQELLQCIKQNLKKKFYNKQEVEDWETQISKRPILRGVEAQQIKFVDEIDTIDDYLQTKYKNTKVIEIFKPQVNNLKYEIIEKLMS